MPEKKSALNSDVRPPGAPDPARRRPVGLLVALIAGAAVWWLIPADGLTPETRRLAALFVGTLILWVTEALPIGVTALLAVAAQPVLQVTSMNVAGARFMSPVFFFVFAMDVLPTLLDIAGIEHQQNFLGREVLPLRGASMMPALKGASDRVHPEDYVMGWELFGRRAIRQGDWKIVWEAAGTRVLEPHDPGIAYESWRLYNVAQDPGERIDLAGQHPDVLRTLIAHWDEYARETGIVLPDYSADSPE